ncbi:MAG: DHH family phosphoesterase [Candidatus Omnitrophica bacterium]|nr:DHH family phosphoesterase [Candidatus Omnitrophota bacterium]
MNMDKIKKVIKEAKTIVIAGHINPDGDSIGSLLSLGLGLEKIGKKVYMVSPDGVPKRYLHLPGANKIKKEININANLAIAVDCSNKEILGKAFKTFIKAKNILEIDHHEFRRPFGNIKLIDYKAAAVGELIFILLKELNIKISKNIAQNLLISIIVETNSFRLPNVRPETFWVCSELIKTGVDFHKLVETIFWSKSKTAVILTGICLARCRFLRNDKIVWSIIRKSDFSKVGGVDEDVDAVADEMRSITNVRAVVLFREKSDSELRVSLRSKGGMNIALVAEKYNGGGHFDVAGCSLPNNSRAIKRLLKDVENIL